MNNKFPPEWTEINVEDAFEIGRGRVISKTEIKLNRGIYPVYSSQSSNYGRFGYLNTYDFDGEYITWTTDGAYAGSVFYRKGKFNCTNVCGTLKDDGTHKIDLRFISYYLSTVAKNHVSYVGNPKLMNNTFAKINILLPKLAEQKKIVSILTSVDDVIEKIQFQINKLQDLKKSVINELLTKGIGHKDFKDTEIGRIPNNWELKKMSDIADIIDPHPSHRAPSINLNGIPFIGIGDIEENGNVLLSSVRKVSVKIFDEHNKRYQISKNTIGLGRVASIGKIIDFRNYNEKILISPTMAIIEPKEVIKTYLINILKSNFLIKQINFLTTGSTRSSLGIMLIRYLLVPVAPIVEQKKIANIILSLDDEISTITKKFNKYIFFKKISYARPSNG